jgi:hypothetical protein
MDAHGARKEKWERDKERERDRKKERVREREKKIGGGPNS